MQMGSRQVQPGSNRAPPGPEAQALMQATQIVAATLDADDSVALVEILLQGNAGLVVASERTADSEGALNPPDQVVQASGATVGLPGVAPQTGPAAPPSLLQWARWLAGPVAVVLGTIGYCCYRVRRKREVSVP
jgi:hypothetical protein